MECAPGLVLWRGEGRSGTEGCVFVGCLSEETSGVSSRTQIKFGPGDQIMIYQPFFIKITSALVTEQVPINTRANFSLPV